MATNGSDDEGDDEDEEPDATQQAQVQAQVQAQAQRQQQQGGGRADLLCRVIKNWEEFVFGPAFAIATTPGRQWLPHPPP